jgi:hypothetical protein
MSNKNWSDLLDGGWPAAEPPRGFADRVLARLAVPEPAHLTPAHLMIVREPPRRAWRSTFVFAAVAVAALLIVPLALHRHTTPARAATVAVGVVPDLGLERD